MHVLIYYMEKIIYSTICCLFFFNSTLNSETLLMFQIVQLIVMFHRDVSSLQSYLDKSCCNINVANFFYKFGQI